jgi:hypothetical protein
VNQNFRYPDRRPTIALFPPMLPCLEFYPRPTNNIACTVGSAVVFITSYSSYDSETHYHSR